MPTAAEFVIPPLPPRSPPPIIDGPQPVCKCCFQRGHLYHRSARLLRVCASEEAPD